MFGVASILERVASKFLERCCLLCSLGPVSCSPGPSLRCGSRWFKAVECGRRLSKSRKGGSCSTV